MKITLNGLELKKQAQGDLAVRQVLSEIQNEIHSSGRVLLRVILNGDALPEDWNSDPRLNYTVDQAASLELIIDEPQRLARQILQDAESIISDLNTQTGDLARKYRIGDEVTAHLELAEVLEKLQLVVSGMDLTTRHAARLYPLNEVRGRVKSSVNDLEPVLDRIMDAQKRGDNIALADEIEYELPVCIRAWGSLVEQAHSIVRQADRTA